MSNNVEVRGVARLQFVARFSQVLYVVMGATNALLVLRALLAQSGANEANRFVQFVFAVTDVLMAPFTGIVTGQYTDLYTPIIAIIVYSVIVVILVNVMVAILGRPAQVVTRDE
ncbi:MAG: YggT family protein [Chloroflexota bacterium]